MTSWSVYPISRQISGRPQPKWFAFFSLTLHRLLRSFVCRALVLPPRVHCHSVCFVCAVVRCGSHAFLVDPLQSGILSLQLRNLSLSPQLTTKLPLWCRACVVLSGWRCVRVIPWSMSENARDAAGGRCGSEADVVHLAHLYARLSVASTCRDELRLAERLVVSADSRELRLALEADAARLPFQPTTPHIAVQQDTSLAPEDTSLAPAATSLSTFVAPEANAAPVTVAPHATVEESAPHIAISHNAPHTSLESSASPLHPVLDVRLKRVDAAPLDEVVPLRDSASAQAATPAADVTPSLPPGDGIVPPTTAATMLSALGSRALAQPRAMAGNSPSQGDAVHVTKRMPTRHPEGGRDVPLRTTPPAGESPTRTSRKRQHTSSPMPVAPKRGDGSAFELGTMRDALADSALLADGQATAEARAALMWGSGSSAAADRSMQATGGSVPASVPSAAGDYAYGDFFVHAPDCVDSAAGFGDELSFLVKRVKMSDADADHFMPYIL